MVFTTVYCVINNSIKRSAHVSLSCVLTTLPCSSGVGEAWLREKSSIARRRWGHAIISRIPLLFLCVCFCQKLHGSSAWLAASSRLNRSTSQREGLFLSLSLPFYSIHTSTPGTLTTSSCLTPFFSKKRRHFPPPPCLRLQIQQHLKPRCRRTFSLLSLPTASHRGVHH